MTTSPARKRPQPPAPVPGTGGNRAEPDAPPPYKLPRFDPKWLPAPLRHFAEGHAKSLGVPLEMTCLQALAIPAVLAGHVIDVKARDGWEEPATLYVLTIADSGTGKSPAMRRFTRFLKAVEAQRKKGREGLKAEQAAAAAARDEAAETALAEQLAAMPPDRLFVSDATDERLGTLMQENGGVAAVWAAEPKFFRVAAGAYSKNGGPAVDVMLQAYSGDEVRVERQTAKPVYVDRPRVSIAMMSQRKPVEDFLEATGHDERGELSRFLMCSPPDWRGFKVTGPPMKQDHVELADECARRLGVLGTGPARTVQLTDQASQRFEAWEAEHQRRQRPGGPWRQPAGWVAKMPGLVLRLAGAIHVAEFVMDEALDAHHVSDDALERAIAITEWGFEQACAVYRVTQENVVSRRLERLRDVLREAPGAWRWDLWQRIKGGCGVKTTAHLTDLLDELDRCGELRREQPPPGPKGGRPGERFWLIERGSGEGSRP
jgi:replicative DNA helicase